MSRTQMQKAARELEEVAHFVREHVDFLQQSSSIRKQASQPLGLESHIHLGQNAFNALDLEQVGEMTHDLID